MENAISKEEKGSIEKYFDSKVSNLNVNYQKMYEISKCNTKIVMNILSGGLICLGVTNLSLVLFPPLFLIPGGFVVVNTIKNSINKHKALVKQKATIKK